MVAAVGNSGGHEGQGKPHPGSGQVGPQQQGTQGRWQQVGHHMLHRVGIDGHDANRSSPLVVALVDVLVDAGMVKQSARDEWILYGV